MALCSVCKKPHMKAKSIFDYKDKKRRVGLKYKCQYCDNIDEEFWR